MLKSGINLSKYYESISICILKKVLLYEYSQVLTYNMNIIYI